MKFKVEHDFERRQSEACRVLDRYPDRVPVICEKLDRSKLEDIAKKKYLVPRDLTVGQFMYVVRKRLNLKPTFAIFLFINGLVPKQSEMLSVIYDKHSDEDGFLYISFAEEAVFG